MELTALREVVLPSLTVSLRDRVGDLSSKGVHFSMRASVFFQSTSALITNTGSRGLWTGMMPQPMTGVVIGQRSQAVVGYYGSLIEDFLAALRDPQCIATAGPALICGTAYPYREAGVVRSIMLCATLSPDKPPHVYVFDDDNEFIAGTKILFVKA